MCFPKRNLTLIIGRKTTSNILNIAYYNKASFPVALIAPASTAALCAGFFTAVQEAGESVCLGISPSPHTPVSPSPYTRLPLLSRPCMLQQGPGADASPLGTRVPSCADAGLSHPGDSRYPRGDPPQGVPPPWGGDRPGQGDQKAQLEEGSRGMFPSSLPT